MPEIIFKCRGIFLFIDRERVYFRRRLGGAGGYGLSDRLDYGAQPKLEIRSAI